MSEGGISAHKAEGAGPEAGGMPVAAVPTAKRFFLAEYIGEVRRGMAWMRTSPKPDEGILNKVRRGFIKWTGLRKARVGIVAVLLIAFSAYGVFASQAASTAIVPGLGPVGPGPTGGTFNDSVPGSVPENGNVSISVELPVTRPTTFVLTVSWSDPSPPIGLTNGPDQVGFEVKAPNGQNWTKAPTTTSPLTWTLDDFKDYGQGAWTVNVIGGTMGDLTRAGGLPGPCPRCAPDTSASFTLDVEAAW